MAAGLDAPVIYPLAELLDAKAERPVYSVTGTHWTHVGAHVAYETICRELSAAGVELEVIGYDEIVWREFQHPVEGDSVRGRPKTPHSQIVFDNRVFNHGRDDRLRARRWRRPHPRPSSGSPLRSIC